MSDWNSIQYKKFIKQRSQPAKDLAMRIAHYAPKTVLDIGCGPGNSTKILKEIFPTAKLLGIDSSPNMIAKAKEDHPDIDFCVCNALSIEGKFDVIYSNACFQWIPDHKTFLPDLMEKLNANGFLAVQMPYNNDEPLYCVINEVVSEPKWGFDCAKFENNITLDANEYYKILSECFSDFDIWETKYYLSMPDHMALIEWVKSTKLRPYLAFLGEEKGKELEEEILKRAKKHYPIQSDGNILFGFRRLFFIAKKS